MKENRLVYIASPYAGNIKVNEDFARKACRYAMEQSCTPMAVHLLYPQILKDEIPAEREVGIRMGLRVLEACDELWLCGDRMSAGMQAELEAAEQLGIHVRQVSRQEIEHGIHFEEKKFEQTPSSPVWEMCQC